MSSNHDVFSELEQTMKDLGSRLTDLGATVQTFVNANGAGEKTRKILRSKLKQAKIREICENTIQAPNEVE